MALVRVSSDCYLRSKQWIGTPCVVLMFGFVGLSRLWQGPVQRAQIWSSVAVVLLGPARRKLKVCKRMFASALQALRLWAKRDTSRFSSDALKLHTKQPPRNWNLNKLRSLFALCVEKFQLELGFISVAGHAGACNKHHRSRAAPLLAGSYVLSHMHGRFTLHGSFFGAGWEEIEPNSRAVAGVQGPVLLLATKSGPTLSTLQGRLHLSRGCWLHWRGVGDRAAAPLRHQ